MNFSLHLEQPELSDSGTTLSHFLVRLETPPAHEAHIPLLVALVIDRSKSMEGEKLRSVVEAANALASWLTRKDSLAVVAYDMNVEVIQPLLPLTDKVSVMKRIEGIRAGSSTNLSGGWLQGLRMVEEAGDSAGEGGGAAEDDRSAFRRVILLTDGMANAGIVNPVELSRIAREHFQRGISTTTIGFGSDFSESLLSQLAAEGGGNFLFIEGPEQANAVFFREFGEIAALYGQGLEIRLRFADGVTVREVLHEIPHDREGGDLILRPGDLRSDDLQNIVLVLEIDGPRASKASGALITADCSFYNIPAGARMERLHAEARAVFSANPATTVDATVRLESILAGVSRCLLEASRLTAERDLTSARELIRRMRSRVQESSALSPDLLGRVDERLQASEQNLDENLLVLSKRLMAEAAESTRLSRPAPGMHDRILDATLSGQLDLYRCPELKARVRRAMDQGYRFIVVDMSQLSYVDSSGIGALIQIFNWLKNRNGLLVLANIQSGVERIFQMSKLDEFFVSRDSPASARMLIEELLQPG